MRVCCMRASQLRTGQKGCAAGVSGVCRRKCSTIEVFKEVQCRCTFWNAVQRRPDAAFAYSWRPAQNQQHELML